MTSLGTKTAGETNQTMKLSRLIRLFSFLVCVSGLASCASSSMVMESVTDPAYSKSLQRVLIVSNGELFPEVTRKMLFFPSVDVLQRLLSQHGIDSSVIQSQKNELNPSVQQLAAARDLKATHILFFSVSKVSSWGPVNQSESDPRNQYRLVASYTYSFTIADLQTRRNVWKGELRGGSGGSTEDNLRQFEEKLKEHLSRAKLLTS